MSNHSYEITHYRDTYLKTVSMHSHDFFELYFFVSGAAGYIIENLHYKLQSGDLLLISPQNLHQLDINDTRVSYERMVLWLNPRYVKQLSTEKTDLSLCFSKAVKERSFLIRDYNLSEKLRPLLLSLSEQGDTADFGDDVFSETLVKRILVELCRFTLSPHCFNPDGALDGQDIANANTTVSTLISYIESNLENDLSLDRLAEHMYASKFYLSRIFKEETNTTLHQFILKKRLLLSKRYIEQGLHVTEVYLRCGFTDYSHFFRAFKQEFGITPKQYFSLINRP